MPPALQLRFTGDMGRVELDRIRKLLNMSGYARLDDHADTQFGSRLLYQADDGHGRTVEHVALTLDRVSNGDWIIQLGYLEAPPPAEMVDQLAAEALVAAERVGFILAGVSPGYRPAETNRAVLELPTRRSLTVTLGGVGKDFRSPLGTLEVALDLRRELGGETSTEFGWRFLRRDQSRWVLLQLLWNPPANEVQVVVYDDQADTDAALLHACRLQISAAAMMAGLTREAEEPAPRSGELSALDVAARAAGVENLNQLWGRFDARDASKELKRGILLAALAPLVRDHSTQTPPTLQGFARVIPEGAPIPETLREETESFLLNLHEM